MSSYFTLRHNRSIIRLSIHRPRPSMLTDVPADSTASRNTSPVNCAPWSLLEMSGTRFPAVSVRSQARTQNSLSIVFEISHANT